MKSQFLHISINIVEPVNERALKRKLDLANDWVHYMPSCWIVRTTSDIPKWYQRLSPLIGKDSAILIVKMEVPEQAYRLPAFALDWLEKYQPKPTSIDGRLRHVSV